MANTIVRQPLFTSLFPNALSWPLPAPWQAEAIQGTPGTWVSPNVIDSRNPSPTAMRYATTGIQSKNQYIRMKWLEPPDPLLLNHTMKLITRLSNNVELGSGYQSFIQRNGQIDLRRGPVFLQSFNLDPPVVGDIFELDTYENELGQYKLQVLKNGVVVIDYTDPSPLGANSYAPWGPWGIPAFETYRVLFGSLEIGTSLITDIGNVCACAC